MNGKQVCSPTGTKRTIGAPTQLCARARPSPNLNLDGGKNDPPRPLEYRRANRDTAAKTPSTRSTVRWSIGLTDMEYDTGGGTFAPLDKGPIALQAEFAEVYFRNIKIKVLP